MASVGPHFVGALHGIGLQRPVCARHGISVPKTRSRTQMPTELIVSVDIDV